LPGYSLEESHGLGGMDPWLAQQRLQEFRKRACLPVNQSHAIPNHPTLSIYDISGWNPGNLIYGLRVRIYDKTGRDFRTDGILPNAEIVSRVTGKSIAETIALNIRKLSFNWVKQIHRDNFKTSSEMLSENSLQNWFFYRAGRAINSPEVQ
jgi:hypothetical protein